MRRRRIYFYVTHKYFPVRLKVLEGYGGRCGEVTLDNQETTQAEMDKVSVLMALR